MKKIVSSCAALLMLGSALPALADDSGVTSSSTSSTTSTSTSSSSVASTSSKPGLRLGNRWKEENKRHEGKKSSLAGSIDTTCVQTAVSAREQAIVAAWSTYNTAVVAAHTARSSALATAWGNSDAVARKTAIKTAWNTFGASIKTATKTMRTTKKSVWETFKTTVKNTCKSPEALSIESQGQELDAD